LAAITITSTFHRLAAWGQPSTTSILLSFLKYNSVIPSCYPTTLSPSRTGSLGI
jgi:hypothetical protein